MSGSGGCGVGQTDEEVDSGGGCGGAAKVAGPADVDDLFSPGLDVCDLPFFGSSSLSSSVGKSHCEEPVRSFT